MGSFLVLKWNYEEQNGLKAVMIGIKVPQIFFKQQQLKSNSPLTAAVHGEVLRGLSKSCCYGHVSLSPVSEPLTSQSTLLQAYHTHTHTHTRTHTHAHTHTRTHTHAHTHTRTRSHTHVHTLSSSCVCFWWCGGFDEGLGRAFSRSCCTTRRCWLSSPLLCLLQIKSSFIYKAHLKAMFVLYM